MNTILSFDISVHVLSQERKILQTSCQLALGLSSCNIKMYVWSGSWAWITMPRGQLVCRSPRKTSVIPTPCHSVWHPIIAKWMYNWMGIGKNYEQRKWKFLAYPSWWNRNPGIRIQSCNQDVFSRLKMMCSLNSRTFILLFHDLSSVKKL